MEFKKLYLIACSVFLLLSVNADAKTDKDYEMLTPKYASAHLPKLKSAQKRTA